MMEMKKEGEWLVGTIAEQDAGVGIGHLLRERWRWPKKLVHLLFQHKEVLLDGTAVAQHATASTGQMLAVRVLVPEEDSISPVQEPLAVLYEDDHLLIVNKPAGLLLHPTEASHRLTLDHLVAGHFQATGVASKVRHIHRLDQDTSGAVLYAKHALAGALLDEALRIRTITRTYVAYVQGVLGKRAGTVNEPIGRDRHHPVRRRVTPGGDAAVTHYRLLAQYAQHAKIECQLDTGRTHQIRVHMSHLGHPLVGDTLYGGHIVSGSGGASRHAQALHAANLSLVHPFTGEPLQVAAPLPDELVRLEKVLESLPH